MNFSITLLKTLQEAAYNCSKEKAVSFRFEKRDLNLNLNLNFSTLLVVALGYVIFWI